MFQKYLNLTLKLLWLRCLCKDTANNMYIPELEGLEIKKYIYNHFLRLSRWPIKFLHSVKQMVKRCHVSTSPSQTHKHTGRWTNRHCDQTYAWTKLRLITQTFSITEQHVTEGGGGGGGGRGRRVQAGGAASGPSAVQWRRWRNSAFQIQTPRLMETKGTVRQRNCAITGGGGGGGRRMRGSHFSPITVFCLNKQPQTPVT